MLSEKVSIRRSVKQNTIVLNKTRVSVLDVLDVLDVLKILGFQQRVFKKPQLGKVLD